MNKKRIPVIFLFIFILFFLTYIVNETPFMYSTPYEYSLPDYSKISPDYRPIFINKNFDSTIIFLHGFKSTPLQFKELADYFSKNYNVLVPLYPGHGTNKEDFKKTYFSQWYKHAEYIYLETRRKYKKVYLCGLSMGGTIALKLAEEFCCDKKLSPDGVISISSPVFLNNLREGILYDYRLYIDRYISWFIKELKNKLNTSDKDGAINDVPSDYEPYDFPVQVHSLKMGMYETKKNLNKINAPLLLMHAKGDETVPFKNLNYIRKNVSSKMTMVREFDLTGWSHTKHIIINYNTTKNEVRKEIVEFLISLN